MRGRIIDIKKLQRGGKMFAYDKYFMFLSMPGFLSIINTSYSHDNHSIISFWNFVSYFFPRNGKRCPVLRYQQPECEYKFILLN